MAFVPAVRVVGLMVGKWFDSNQIMPQQTSTTLPTDKTIPTKSARFEEEDCPFMSQLCAKGSHLITDPIFADSV